MTASRGWRRVATVAGLAVALGGAGGCASTPPRSPDAVVEPELVDLATLDPTLRFDIRYATARNFVGRPVYPAPRAFLERHAAAALLAAHRSLAVDGFGLLVFDGYRPWRVTRLFWRLTPPAQRDFVADPAKGSRHNRGCAVDVTLYRLATGAAVDMPSDYDDFSERAHPDWSGGDPAALTRRDRLRRAMESVGFTVYVNEWWHYDFQGWERYVVLDRSFAEVDRALASAAREPQR